MKIERQVRLVMHFILRNITIDEMFIKVLIWGFYYQLF